MNLLLVAVGGFLFGKFFPSYFSEKGKNLATKEDISQITNSIENVKSIYNNEDKVLEKRRQIYEKIAYSLTIFISGHGVTKEQETLFYDAYAAAWLWASESVLVKLNIFINTQINHTENKEVITQEKMKLQYGEIILEMRRDVGFKETELEANNYIFATFGSQ